MMNLISIPAIQDNYIWILVNDQNRCAIIDPGEAKPVLTAVRDNGWQPDAILLTHHHYDHVGGVFCLLEQFPQIVVYGPVETLDKGATQIVGEGEGIIVLDLNFSVLATPGHTSGHLSYYSSPYLFCGDTLFSGGCGRIIEGTSALMYRSLEKINSLPDNTIICCSHEYTLENMKFAKNILPDDPDINDYYRRVMELRTKNKKTLPVILGKERKINLFLQINHIDVVNKIAKLTNIQKPETLFAWLRSKKDDF